MRYSLFFLVVLSLCGVGCGKQRFCSADERVLSDADPPRRVELCAGMTTLSGKERMKTVYGRTQFGERWLYFDDSRLWGDGLNLALDRDHRRVKGSVPWCHGQVKFSVQHGHIFGGCAAPNQTILTIANGTISGQFRLNRQKYLLGNREQGNLSFENPEILAAVFILLSDLN